MKKGYLFVLAAAVVLLFAMGVQPAFALHSGFAATTTDCRSCHAVHNATGSNLFIQGSKTGANNGITVTLGASSQAIDMCMYCHVAGTTHGVYQYGINKTGVQASSLATVAAAMHEIGATTTPDASSASNGLVDGALSCLDCHNAMPHDAKDLGVKYAGKAIYAQDASVNAFCSRCHDLNTHTDGTTHPVGDTATAAATVNTTNYGTQQVAFSDATDCSKCHLATDLHFGVWGANTATTTTVNGVVTAVSGKAFTTYGTGLNYKGQAVNVLADAECLSCHQNGTAGVGLTY